MQSRRVSAAAFIIGLVVDGKCCVISVLVLMLSRVTDGMAMVKSSKSGIRRVLGRSVVHSVLVGQFFF